MVSTSQYLGDEDYHEMSGLRSPEQGPTARPGAQGAGVLESLVSWEEQTQQNLGSIIVLTPFTHNMYIHHHYFYHKICLCHFTSVSYPIIKMRHLKGIVTHNKYHILSLTIFLVSLLVTALQRVSSPADPASAVSVSRKGDAGL